MGDGDCARNYDWELDQSFRATGNKDLDQNIRANILRGIGIPKTIKPAKSEDESSDSDFGEIFDRKLNILQDEECGYPCENDVGWFDIVQSHAPWAEERRPYDQLLMYEDLSLTDKEKQGKLSGMIMSTGLNLLDAVPMTDGFALTKLQLPDKGLQNIQILDSYKYIQYVDLSHNAIQDLSPLDSLTYLIVLDASHNEIEYFQPSPTPWFLSFLNLSYNKLKNVPDLSSMWSLKHLNLSNNLIEKIEGIEDLNYLEYVNLSYNAIQVLENISKVPLKTLDLSWNKIKGCMDSRDETGGLRNIITLQRLDVSHNLIASMYDLQCINPYSLRHLNVAHNAFDSATSFDDLVRYKSLRYLRLEENPLVHALPEIVKHIIHLLPQLAYINGNKLTKEMRVGVFSTWNPHPLIKEMKRYCYELLYSNVEPPDYGTETSAHLDFQIPIVIIMGPMGTRKYTLAKHIADRYPEYVRRPFVHSTLHEYSEENPDVCEEFKNINLHHVDEIEFNKMWNRGDFVFVFNDMGDLYGLVRTELEDDGRLILVAMPVQPALNMTWQGLNTTLILVEPQDEKEYSDLLQRMIVSKSFIRKERDEAKEIQGIPEASQEVQETETDEEEEEEEFADASMASIRSTASKRSLKKKGSKSSFGNDEERPDQKRSVEFEPSSRSLYTHSISVVETKKNHLKTSLVMPDYESNEYRMTLDAPWWCSDESTGELDIEHNEEPIQDIPYIETLKTHMGEKEKMWTLYHAYYPEAEIYYKDFKEKCQHLLAKTVVIDSLDKAMRKILPILAEQYNLTLKRPKEDKKDPLYDVLIEPRLNEMMEILANRGVMGRFDMGESGKDGSMSSELSKSTLSAPFFSALTSSLDVTPSTSITEFGSQEMRLEEPGHLWAPSAPPTPPETPSSALESIAKDSMKRAGFITHEAQHSIRYNRDDAK